MLLYRLTMIALMSLAAPSTSAQGFGELQTTIGLWAVYSDQSSMTDDVSCIALYKDDPSIQLAQDSNSNFDKFILAVVFKKFGAVKRYRERFDNENPSDFLYPDQVEQSIGTLVWLGSHEFDRLLHASRMRLELETGFGQLVNLVPAFGNG